MTEMAVDVSRSRTGWSAEVRSTLALAWPLVLTNLAQAGMTTTDIVLIGRLGPDALAAAALATNVYFAFLLGSVGLVSATAPMVARELGRRRHSVRDIRRTFRQGLWSAIAVALPIWAVMWQTEPILLFLGQEPRLAAAAATYIHALQWSLLPFLFYIVIRSLISAMERPHAGLWVGLVAIAVNALVGWGLIFGHFGLPRLGLIGAGVATVFSSTALFVGLVLYLLFDRRFRRYRFFGRFWRADWPRFRELWRLGIPIGLALAFEVTFFNAAAFLMGLIGAASLAAYAITIQFASLTFMVPLGLSQAATVRVGLAFGAGDTSGIHRAGWTAFALGVGFMALMAMTMILVPRPIVGAFIDLSDPGNATVIALAVSFMALAGVFQVVDGAQVVGAGMLRGLHDTRAPMVFAALGYWGIGLPLGLLLAFRLGYEGRGIWIGIAIGLAIVAAMMTGRFALRRRLGLMSARPAASARPP